MQTRWELEFKAGFTDFSKVDSTELFMTNCLLGESEGIVLDSSKVSNFGDELDADF